MPPVDGHAGLTDSSLRKLAAASDWRQRAIAAGDSACPQDVLTGLLEGRSRKGSERISYNDPYAVLTRLVERVDESCRLWLVRTADLPQANLKKFASDKSVEVRRALAESPQSLHDVLMTLLHNGDDHVRISVADNESCPEEAFPVLATCRDGCFVKGLFRRTLPIQLNCREKVLAFYHT